MLLLPYWSAYLSRFIRGRLYIRKATQSGFLIVIRGHSLTSHYFDGVTIYTEVSVPLAKMSLW
jgi:hypothetical protein